MEPSGDIKLEIQEFYKVEDPKRPDFMGTMHIYVEVKGVAMDLMGYQVYKKGKKINIYPPTQKAIDDGHRVTYPTFSLFDPKLNAELKYFIIKEGRKFLWEKKKAAKKKPPTKSYKESKPTRNMPRI